MIIDLYKFLKNYPALTKRLDCKGMLFTQYDCPQTTGKAHFFVECSYIAYVLKGRRIFHKQTKAWDLNEGVCAYVKKGTHTAERLNNDEWCVMVFFIPDNFLKALVNENRMDFPSSASHNQTEHVTLLDVSEISKSFFQSMLPYFVQSPPPPESLIELKFKELILSLVSNQNNQHFLTYIKGLADDHRQSIEQIMDNNYRFNLSLEQYASLASKSIPTFNREFKKVFKDSPAKWIMKRRLALASELLETSSLRIWEIAHECGFENQTHFSRVFKEKVGSSPMQFRQDRQDYIG